MAVAVTDTGGLGTSGGFESTLTFGINPSGSNRGVSAYLTLPNDALATSCTFGGAALTISAGFPLIVGTLRTYAWDLLNPTAGEANIVITIDNPTYMAGAAIAYSGAGAVPVYAFSDAPALTSPSTFSDNNAEAAAVNDLVVFVENTTLAAATMATHTHQVSAADSTPNAGIAVYTAAGTGADQSAVVTWDTGGGTARLVHQAFTIAAAGAATVPGAPTIGTATAGNTTASVAFTAPGSDGGSAILDYRISAVGGGVGPWTGITSSPGSATGLTNGVAKTFTVAARNAVGYSAESAASNSVTPSAPSFNAAFAANSNQIIGAGR